MWTVMISKQLAWLIGGVLDRSIEGQCSAIPFFQVLNANMGMMHGRERRAGFWTIAIIVAVNFWFTLALSGVHFSTPPRPEFRASASRNNVWDKRGGKTRLLGLSSLLSTFKRVVGGMLVQVAAKSKRR